MVVRWTDWAIHDAGIAAAADARCVCDIVLLVLVLQLLVGEFSGWRSWLEWILGQLGRTMLVN
jgi:hypothetical protein